MLAAREGESLNDGAYKTGVDATLKEASQAAEVSQVSKLTTTKDGRIGYADVVYPVPSSEISEAARQELADIAATGEKAGLQVEFSGGIAAEFLVRLTLVPAVMALLGKRAWWMPKKLSAYVPDLDIEGANVEFGGGGSSR